MSTVLLNTSFRSHKEIALPSRDITLNEFKSTCNDTPPCASTSKPIHLVKSTLSSVLNSNYVSSPASFSIPSPISNRSEYNLSKSKLKYHQQVEENQAINQTMKQNISDNQSKSHIPTQIQLVTDSMKSSNGNGNGVTDNGYVNHSIENCEESNLNTPKNSEAICDNSSNAPELRLRHSGSEQPEHQRTASMDSRDLANIINKQQQSLRNIASQRQHHTADIGLSNGTTNHTGMNIPHDKKGRAALKLDLKASITEMTDSSTIVQIAPGSPVSNGPGGEEPPNGFLSSDKLDPSEMKKAKWANLKKLLAGVTLTLMSALCFSITTVIVKYVTDIKPSQMALFRYVGILVLSFPVMVESKEPWFGENNWWWRLWMLLRGLSGCTSLFFRYSAVTYISLADTTIIMLSMPVFVFIFARIFLGEQFGRYHVMALCLSIVGIAFASKIELFFNKDDGGNSTTTTIIPEGFGTSIYNSTTTMASATTALPDDEISSTTKQLIGSLYALGAMVVGSLVYIMVRKMRKTHHSVILFNFAIISIVEMSLINFIFYDFHLPTTGYSAYLVTILAVFSFYGQLLLTKAIQIEEAGVVSVVRVSGEAFFAFVFQIVFFHEIPDIYTIAGAILVLTSVFLLSYRKYIISLPDDSPTKKKFRFLTK